MATITPSKGVKYQSLLMPTGPLTRSSATLLFFVAVAHNGGEKGFWAALTTFVVSDLECPSGNTGTSGSCKGPAMLEYAVCCYPAERSSTHVNSQKQNGFLEVIGSTTAYFFFSRGLANTFQARRCGTGRVGNKEPTLYTTNNATTLIAHLYIGLRHLLILCIRPHG